MAYTPSLFEQYIFSLNPGRNPAQDVTPALQSVTTRAQQYLPTGVALGILPIGGTRNEALQANLKAAGWSKTMNSFHLAGRALDLIPMVNGQPDLRPETFQLVNAAMDKAAAELNVPITWGGDWQKFPDQPHYQVKAADASAFNPPMTYDPTMGQLVPTANLYPIPLNAQDWANRTDPNAVVKPNSYADLIATNLTPDKMATISNVASRLGVSPVDLAAISGLETAGTYSPTKTNDYGFIGSIQFSPNIQATGAYGWSPNLTFDQEWNGPVYNYLKDAGVGPGWSREAIYAAINQGPGAVTADGQIKPGYLSKTSGGQKLSSILDVLNNRYVPATAAVMEATAPSIASPLNQDKWSYGAGFMPSFDAHGNVVPGSGTPTDLASLFSDSPPGPSPSPTYEAGRGLGAIAAAPSLPPTPSNWLSGPPPRTAADFPAAWGAQPQPASYRVPPNNPEMPGSPQARRANLDASIASNMGQLNAKSAQGMIAALYGNYPNETMDLLGGAGFPQPPERSMPNLVAPTDPSAIMQADRLGVPMGYGPPMSGIQAAEKPASAPFGPPYDSAPKMPDFLPSLSSDAMRAQMAQREQAYQLQSVQEDRATRAIPGDQVTGGSALFGKPPAAPASTSMGYGPPLSGVGRPTPVPMGVAPLMSGVGFTPTSQAATGITRPSPFQPSTDNFRYPSEAPAVAPIGPGGNPKAVAESRYLPSAQELDTYGFQALKPSTPMPAATTAPPPATATVPYDPLDPMAPGNTTTSPLIPAATSVAPVAAPPTAAPPPSAVSRAAATIDVAQRDLLSGGFPGVLKAAVDIPAAIRGVPGAVVPDQPITPERTVTSPPKDYGGPNAGPFAHGYGPLGKAASFLGADLPSNPLVRGAVIPSSTPGYSSGPFAGHGYSTSSGYPATASQVDYDLHNPTNTTYKPSNYKKGGKAKLKRPPSNPSLKTGWL